MKRTGCLLAILLMLLGGCASGTDTPPVTSTDTANSAQTEQGATGATAQGDASAAQTEPADTADTADSADTADTANSADTAEEIIPLTPEEATLEVFLTQAPWDTYESTFGQTLSISFGEGRVFTFTADEEQYAGSFRHRQYESAEGEPVHVLELTLSSWPEGMDIYAVGGSVQVMMRVDAQKEYLTILSNTENSTVVPSIFDPYYDAFDAEKTDTPDAMCDRVTFTREHSGAFLQESP